jgi:hypothetical protein
MKILNYISDEIRHLFKTLIKDIEKDFYRYLDRILYNYKKKILREIISTIIIFTSIIFILISLVFLFIEYFHLSKTISFGLIGLLLLLLSLIIKALK